MSLASMATVAPQVGHLLVQGDGHAVKAGVQQRLEGAELGGEAVAGIDARNLAATGNSRSEGGVFANECNGPGPGRDCVDRLAERHADHRPDRIAGAAGPASLLKFGHKLADFR